MSRKDAVQYWMLSVGALALMGWLFQFWFRPERLNQSLPLWAAVLLLATLSFVMFHRPALEALTWVIARKQAPVVRHIPQRGLRVATITTFVAGSEPIGMLARTLEAMVKNDSYPHDVWVLDESDDPAAKKLCEYLGVKHFSRKGIPRYNTDGGQFAARTKGGNHNAWYDAHGHNYDIVAQYDTDFVVRQGFISDVLGYFNNPDVAFVGSPQVYGNMNSWVARGAAQQTYSFYGPIMNGSGARGQGLLIGANHTIRVAALQSVGWYFAHLAEDMATGMRLHAAGWKGVYHPAVLAIGEGPSMWQAYFTQQYRWAAGSLDLLMHHTWRLARTMPRRQGLRYAWLQLFYLNGLAMTTGIALLTLFFFTGITPAEMTIREMVEYYLPLLVYRQIMILWLQRFNVRPHIERGMLWAGRILTIAALPVYLMALVGVVAQKRIVFKVTPKGQGDVTHESILLFKHHIAIASVLALATYSGVLLGHTSWIFDGWAAITITLMLGFTFVPALISITTIRYRQSRRAIIAWWDARAGQGTFPVRPE